MLSTLLAVVLMAGTTVTDVSWYNHYDKALRLIEQGNATRAQVELQSALKLREKEGLQVRTGSQQYIDYIPHLYLAIAHQMTGDVEGARKELALAEDAGVAVRSDVGRSLLVAYQLLLRGSTAGRLARPAYAVYSRKAPVLSESDFNVLRADIMEKFDVPAGTRSDRIPWYANYELGLELERKGDYPRALTHFIDAVSRRPDPQPRARMYGVWMIDYYPYFHIARSHVRLANWQGAKNALQISEKVGEIPMNAPEMNEYLSLQQETERRLSAEN